MKDRIKKGGKKVSLERENHSRKIEIDIRHTDREIRSRH